MSTPISTRWLYLVRKPGSVYRQLFVKGTRVMARILYGMYAREEEPLTPDEIARQYDLPLEAIREAIAYCESNPPEIQEDLEADESQSWENPGANNTGPAQNFLPPG